MQFLSENRVNRCQIFERFGFLKTESKPNFRFPHIRTVRELVSQQIVCEATSS